MTVQEKGTKKMMPSLGVIGSVHKGNQNFIVSASVTGQFWQRSTYCSMEIRLLYIYELYLSNVDVALYTYRDPVRCWPSTCSRWCYRGHKSLALIETPDIGLMFIVFIVPTIVFTELTENLLQFPECIQEIQRPQPKSPVVVIVGLIPSRPMSR
ncbi:hypothetical protein EV368DRAFT_60944 [Lentinula lateritia]|nr:hypothetical protein EV368DRAFT_60944 [Lentinula lateritia]